MSSSFGVDSSKGATNVSNPYDFKNVQVTISPLLIMSVAKATTQFLPE
jgi:hypothetical protein